MVGDMTAYFRRRHHLYVPTISEYDTFQFMIGNYVQHYHDAPVIILPYQLLGMVDRFGQYVWSLVGVDSYCNLLGRGIDVACHPYHIIKILLRLKECILLIRSAA